MVEIYHLSTYVAICMSLRINISLSKRIYIKNQRSKAVPELTWPDLTLVNLTSPILT